MKDSFIFSDDEKIIDWLDSNNDFDINFARVILKEYYNSCKDSLKNIDQSTSPFTKDSEKKSVCSIVKSALQIESFKDECVSFFGKNVDYYLNLLNEFQLTKEQEWDLVKVCRLYNMRLKLAHSARITYIAMYELNIIVSKIPEERKNDENIKLLKSSVILSALLHDVGRFYQAINYNNFNDNVMKEKEDSINDLKVDHAVAGYYYSLLTAFEFHKLINPSDYVAKRKFVLEAIAATVVMFHQNPNSQIEYFDYNGDINVLLENNDTVDSLYKFISTAYNNAQVMNFLVQDKLSDKHKEFIDNFAKKVQDIIVTRIKDNSFNINGFVVNIDPTIIEEYEVLIKNKLSEILSRPENKELKDINSIGNEISDELINKFIDIINKNRDEYYDITIDDLGFSIDEEKEELSKTICHCLEGMLKYDVSKSISNMYTKGYSIPNDVRLIISSALSTTMDADKIDILNQRALGIYNVPYNPTSYPIFPKQNMSLIDMLNEYFNYKLDKNSIYIDSSIINIINNLGNDTRTKLLKVLENVEGFNSFIESRETEYKYLKKGITIQAYNSKFIVIDEKSGIKKEFDSSIFYRMFNDNYIDFMKANCNLDDLPFLKFKEKYCDELRLFISAEALNNNTEGLSYEEKLNIYKKIMVSDSLIKKFKLNARNSSGIGWICATDNEDIDSIGDREHILPNNVTGLLWQLNQFLLVNIKNIYSCMYVKENQILDKIYEQYENKAPLIANILKEYIDYVKDFVDNVIEKYERGEIGDKFVQADLENIRSDFYNNYLSLDSKKI